MLPALFAFLFGTPWSAAAVAGAVVAIPVVIHLLNRRRYRVVTWAAMRFLLAAQRQNARRLRLEQFLLLAVRCLLLLLLALAVASVTPWAEAIWRWLAPNAVVARAVRTHRTYKVLVLDGSFSMALRGADGTAFDRARAVAGRILRESPAGDGFSVLLMAAPPRRVVAEPSEDTRKVAAEVEALRLPHGGADVAATLATVENLLQGAPAKFPEKEVYFLTDLQRSTWLLPRPGQVAATLQKIQAAARTVFVDVGREPPGNLAVTGLALADDLATTGRATTVVATLQNFGETREAVGVRLRVGRARAVAGEPACEPHVVHEVQVRAERGQQTPVAFSYKFPTPGDYLVQVEVDADDLDLDDTRAAVVPVRQDVPAALVNGKPEGDPFDQATEWLRLALNPYEGQSAPGFVAARPRVLRPSQFADEGQGDLRGFDCVFLCDVPSPSLAETRRLERHVRRGGGVVVFLGDQVRPGEYNRLLYRAGLGLLPVPLVGTQSAPDHFRYQLALEEGADREAPLKAFRGAADRNSLLTPRFRRFFQLGEPAGPLKPRRLLSFVPVPIPGREPQPTDSTAPPPGGIALLAWNPPLEAADAESRSGERDAADPRPAPRVPRPARGRVVLVNTTANSDWSTWPATPSYPAFVHELLLFASAGRLREQSVTVGDPLELFDPEAAAGEVTFTAPDGQSETIRVQAGAEAGVVRREATDLAGVYRAAVAGQPREYLFAVNVPVADDSGQASESDLDRTSRDELQRTYPEWEFQVVTDPRQVDRTTAAGAAAPVELVAEPLGTAVARWLLLAVLGLVVAEIVLAWRFGHHDSSTGRSSVSGVAAAPSAAARALRTVLRVLTVGLFAAAALLGVVLIHSAWTGDFLGFLPGRLRGAIEALLHIPPPAPGEGSRWRLEFAPYLWSPAVDPWLVSLVAASVVALAYAVHRLEAASVGRPRLALTGLRTALLLLVLAVLLPQVRLWFERQSWPDVAILIDDSHSMSAADRYRDPRVQEVADRLAAAAGLSTAERLRLAQALVTRSDPDWLTALLTRRQLRVHVYRCSGRAHRVADVTAPADVPHALQAVESLHADARNDSSRLGSAVRQVLNEFRGSSLAALVMLTDGVTTEGEDLVKASHYAAQSGVPLYLVGIGDAHEARDLRLHDLQVEDSVYVHDRVVFELRLSGQGYEGLTVPVTLREKGKDQPLDVQQSVRVDAAGRPVKVRLVHQPAEPGEKVYVVEVPAQPDETDRDNNRLERAVTVREAKLVKVLYVEGYRRYEYHYLKTLLERESDRAKGNKSIDLKVVLLDADADYAAQDRSALPTLPATEAELNEFDVVILGDVDPRPADNPKVTDFLKLLADFVRERGGGLLVIAGERYAPQAYRDTSLRDVLPIDVTAERPSEPADGARVTGYRPELTPVGRLHPIFRFTPDERENDQVWGRLREMYWWAEGYQPKRAAEVLAVQPLRRAGGGAARPAAADARPDRHPLVVQQFVGAGRSLFFGFNETWRWGFREDQLRYNQFWVQTVRYLARNRLGKVDLRLDRQSPYRRGEPIKVTVRFPDDAPPPPADTEVKVVAERRSPSSGGEAEVRTIQLTKLEGSRATYEAVLTRTPEGDYRFWLSQPAVPDPKPRAESRVLAPPGEMEQLRMNQPDLERAAAESRGRFYTLADADRLVDDLPGGSRVTLSAPAPPLPLWDHPLLFVLAVALLTAEWLWRKEWNLL